MPISPRLKRFFDCFPKCDKVVERSAARIVIASDSRLGQIQVAMTTWIVAFAIEICVFAFGERGGMQSMRRVERHLQSQKSRTVSPRFRKKIFALMQTNAVQRNYCVHAFVDVSGQTFGCNGTFFQPDDLFIQIAMIEFGAQCSDTSLD